MLGRRDSIAKIGLRYGTWLVEVKRIVGSVMIVSHVILFELHIDKHLHLVGFVRVPLPSEQGSALSD